MTTLLLLGVMALSFLLASGGSAWFCVGLAARLPLALARSSRVQAGLVLFPLAIGAFVAISLLSPMSLLSGCHCLAHPHHVHICFEHTALSAALACFALLGGAGALRSLVLWVGVLRGAMDTSDWSSRVDTRAVRDGVEVVPELGAHAITVGLWRPRVMVGASLWSSLDADGQRAVEAHEQAHVARRDILTLFCLRLAACALPARFGRHLLDRWRRAAEFACDRAAAQAIGDPCVLAAALVACGKIQLRDHQPTLPKAALAVVDGDDLEARVASLLSAPHSDGSALIRGDLATVGAAAIALTIALTLLGGASAHHGVETMLGWLS